MPIARPPARPRPLLGCAAGAALVVGCSAALLPFRSDVTRATPALAFVVAIVVAGLVGGRAAALAVVPVALAAFNLLFIPPYNTLAVDALDDGVALAVFGLVAVVVGSLVAREGARRQSAEDRAHELDALNTELRAVQEERERLAEEAMRATVLERVDEQRTALLRSVSHDLRTPLATVRAVVSDLLGGPAYDEATRTDLLSLVADEVERLDRLVANLLSLSRIDAGALRPDREPVAIDELLAESVKRLDRLFVRTRVQIDTPPLPLVDGDYSQLDQVVSNLLENAARHSPPGSIVRIGGRDAGEAVEVWIDDEGPGIPPFERARVFEPFRSGNGSASRRLVSNGSAAFAAERLDGAGGGAMGPSPPGEGSRVRHQPPSGIGLAICRAIVEAHGGRITAEAAPGGGARFRFSVPRRDDRAG